MPAKRVSTTTYTCCAPKCGKPASAPADSVLVALQICSDCQAARVAKGRREMEVSLVR
jgi:hypothetical protein